MSAEASSLEKALAAESDIAPGAMIGVAVEAEQLDLLRGEDGRLPSDTFRRLRAQAGPRGPGRPQGSLNRSSKQLAKLLVERFGDPLLAMAETAAMPLDQLVELFMVADGSREREDRLFAVAERVERLADRMLDDGEAGRTLSEKQLDKLTSLVKRAGDLTRTLKVKPGELGLKAFIAQRDTRAKVAEYVHSKMPIAVDHSMRADVILNIPGLTDAAHLADYVEHGELDAESLNRLEYVPDQVTSGAVIEDAVTSEVDNAD